MRYTIGTLIAASLLMNLCPTDSRAGAEASNQQFTSVNPKDSSTAIGDLSGTGSVTVRKGLDLKKFRSMVNTVRANPEYADVEFRAFAQTEDVIYQSMARIGPFSIAGQEYGQTREHILHLGVPVELQEEVVDPVDRIEPVELALAGLADCVIGTIWVHALISDIPVDRVTASVRAPLSLLVLVDLKEIEQRHQMYGQIQVNVVLEGENITEEQRAYLTQQAKRSPVFNLVALAHNIEPNVSVKLGHVSMR